MFKHILIPHDGSEYAHEAQYVATELAGALGAKLSVCYVIDVAQIAALTASAPVSLEPAVQAMEAEAKAVLATVTESLPPLSKTYILSGFPPHEIIGCAQEHGADLIVMGSHGRSGLQRLLVGSVTEAVLRQSHIPVLVSRKARAYMAKVEPDGIATVRAI